MKPESFIRRVWINAPADVVFGWHARPGAFERLTPPWDRVDVLDRTGGIHDGGRVEFRVSAGPVKVRWTVEHRNYLAGRQFCDVQIEGPFASWEHLHRVVPEDARECYLEDEIHYRPPFGSAGRLLSGRAIRRKLNRLFDYRHRVIVEDLRVHREYGDRLKVLVSGSSGLLGAALVPFLTTGGHAVVRLVRADTGESDVRWDPANGTIDTAHLEGMDAVVHLAGENIGEGRWTDGKKERIRGSRVTGTRLLCEALAGLETPPRTLVCASAVGYYGDRGDEVLGEDSAPGSGFLADVCREWEAASEPAAKAGIRVANLRFGAVLTPRGGALAKMLPAFRMGVGGRFGSGDQYMSWISAEDAVGAVHHALMTPALEGPANAVAPRAATNRDFTRTLARVLKRPALFPLPESAARLGLGEMADALLLSSTRAEPAQLKASGYTFREPELERALRHLLGR